MRSVALRVLRSCFSRAVGSALPLTAGADAGASSSGQMCGVGQTAALRGLLIQLM